MNLTKLRLYGTSYQHYMMNFVLLKQVSFFGHEELPRSTFHSRKTNCSSRDTLFVRASGQKKSKLKKKLHVRTFDYLLRLPVKYVRRFWDIAKRQIWNRLSFVNHHLPEELSLIVHFDLENIYDNRKHKTGVV